jgi:hypothetical protein
VGQRQFPQGSQVRDPRSREVQAETSVIIGMQALVPDPQCIKPTPEKPTSFPFGVTVIIVTPEKREDASGRPTARVQSASLATRVSISVQIIRATSPAGRAT